jgi:hypothetical protein
MCYCEVIKQLETSKGQDLQILMRNSYKNHLKTWLTSGSAFCMEYVDGMQASSVFMSMGSSAFRTSMSFSTLTVQMFCNKIINKR